MWCPHCQFDVPAIAAGDSLLRCARCHHPLPVQDDPSWEQLEQDVESLETLLAGAAPLGHPSAGPPSAGHPRVEDRGVDARSRLDRRRVRRDGPHVKLGRPLESPRPGVRRRAPAGRWMAWPFVLLGVMATVCGATLMGWSIAAGRGELWELGMPLALGGQATLLVGLVLQLDGLWQTNRATVRTLDELEEEVEQIRRLSTHAAHDQGKRTAAHSREGTRSMRSRQ